MWLEYRWHHAKKRWAENVEDFEKDSIDFQPWWWELSSDHGVEKLSSDHDVEKLGSDHGVEKLGPTMVLQNWDWTTRCVECWGVVSIV